MLTFFRLVPRTTQHGNTATFDKNKIEVKRNQKVLATGRRIHRSLYLMNFWNQSMKSTEDVSLTARWVSNSARIWHERFGHVSHATVQRMHLTGVVDGLVMKSSSNPSSFCEGCVFEKHHRLPFPTSGRTRATKCGGLVHSDLFGPMSIPSLSGLLYFLTLRDDFSGYGFIRFLTRKSEATGHIKDLISRFDTEIGSPVQIFWTDNRGEFLSNDLTEWLNNKGIEHQTSTQKTPEQNGVAERYNWTILESVKSMLHSSKFEDRFWAEAVETAVYLLKRVLCSAVPSMTPYQAVKGRKPNVSHFHVFGCDAYAHIPKYERSKFALKALKCKFLGYSETQKAFRLWDPSASKVKISRDVVFNEYPIETHSTIQPLPCNYIIELEESVRSGEGGDACVSNGRFTVSNSHFQTDSDNQANNSDPEDRIEPFHGFEPSKSSGDSTAVNRKSTRDRKKPERLIEDPDFFTNSSVKQLIEPKTYPEAIASPQ